MSYAIDLIFAKRMGSAKRSFVREILKVTEKPKMISFAGGLPNPDTFPIDKIAKAAAAVFNHSGKSALQYGTTEGYYPLREYISKRYFDKQGLVIRPDDILITNGSQQGIDLIGKVLLDKNDIVVLEKPGYLGAIQAFGVYEPKFIQIPLLENGIDTERLSATIKKYKPKLFYAVPNFQNPSGITYTLETRKCIANILSKSSTIFVEDDPYGELRFLGDEVPTVRKFMKNNSVLLGSFSKIVAPGIRLGWISAPKEIMGRLITAKQAADLHSNILCQRIVYEHLKHNDLDKHLEQTRNIYRIQRDAMVANIQKYFPKEVKYTQPEGGMFLWVTLPKSVSSMELLNAALRKNVAFVPGEAFYTDGTGSNTMRLNFSNSSISQIEKGIIILSKLIHKFVNNANKR